MHRASHTHVRLYLASTSPARLATLRAAGIEPVLISPGVDEQAVVDAEESRRGAALTAEELVQLLAKAKAEAVIGDPSIDGLVLGGDSAFAIAGRIHGKPHRPEVAKQRWLEQRGASGVLHSGHWLIDHRGGEPADGVGAVASAGVAFADDITEQEIDAYVATGEPLHVAGAFTIDSLGAAFITSVDGDPHAVVGLSVATLRGLVRELGVGWTELWNLEQR
jgi:septum formation protein